MPPLPIRLTEDATNTIDSLERRSRFIQVESLPKLLACTGPLAVQQHLAEDVREDLGVFSRQLETLSMMIDDQSGDRARKELGGIVQKFTDELHELRAHTRNAILTSKKAVDAQQKSNRDELFSGYANGSGGSAQTEKLAEDAINQANSDLTSALRRTINLMQAELEKSVLSTQLLESSTSTLRSTSAQHDTLTSAIEASKHLVTALEKADWLDRLLIMSGFMFFVLVVLFILKERFVDRGIRMAFWWTRFIPDFSGDAELLAREEVKAKVGEAASVVVSSVSSVAGVVSSSVASVVVSSAILDSTSTPAPFESLETETPSSTATETISDESISPILSSIISSSKTLPPSARTRPTEHVEL